MPVQLDRLPYDILFHITGYLGIEDIFSLAYSCRLLRRLMYESTLCRRMLETNVYHTMETRLARERIAESQHIQTEQASYCEALKSVCERKHALASAIPFSARIFGQAYDFCYCQGVLCILQDGMIHVWDGHASSRVLGINLSSIIIETGTSSSSPNEYNLILLHYSDDIVTLHYKRKNRLDGGRILAISTKREVLDARTRLIKEIRLESSHKLFSRHTAEWLYYGTHTGTDTLNREWEIQAVSLLSNSKTYQPFSLRDFFGTDIGSTIAVEIHNDTFFAVSNQTSFEVEEIDFTSFYHCISFPVDKSLKEWDIKVNRRVYRRQNKEGPIHDSWTELTIQFDEQTDKPMIVESRREWFGSSSQKLRTFYMTEFDSQTSLATAARPERELPMDDLFTSLVGPEDKPNFAEDRPRYNPQFHPEVGPENTSPRTFIVAKTKLKAYDLSSNTFLDLVEDDQCCHNSNDAIFSGSCLRLRVGSRRPAPLDWTTPISSLSSSKCTDYKPSIQPSSYLHSSTDNGKAKEEEHQPKRDIIYRYSPIRMWPPSASASTCQCAKKLHRILNPALPSPCSGSSARYAPSGGRYVTGVLDQNALVYMVKPRRGSGEEGGLGVVVMVRFDRCDTFVSRTDNALSTTHWQRVPGGCKEGKCC